MLTAQQLGDKKPRKSMDARKGVVIKKTNKIPALLVMIITILLVTGLFIAVRINNYSTPVIDPSTTSPETATVWVPQGLVINELMADNDRAVQSIYGGYPDWIELFNSGDYPIDLSGMYLTDDLSNLKWRFPDRTVIEPDNYLLIWADADIGRSPLHANFNLLANGGLVGLIASDGETVIDLVVYEKQLADVSYGRIPDGGVNWEYMTTPTPSKANVANPSATTSTPWQIWLLITITIALCVAVILKDNIRVRRNT